jgi:hypothetical protein
MKKFTAVLLSTIALSAAAQDKPKPKISDAFAKAALTALNKISHDIREPKVEGDSILGSKDTVTTISNADVEAVTRAERAIAETLSVLYVWKLEANMTLGAITSVNEMLLPHTNNIESYFSHQKASELAAKDPQVVTTRAKVDVCVAALDTSLRTRSPKVPKVCE